MDMVEEKVFFSNEDVEVFFCGDPVKALNQNFYNFFVEFFI